MKITIVFLLTLAIAAQSQPAKVLFIGNSLTYSRGGVDTMLNNLCDAAGVTMDAQRETVGGMSMSQHSTRAETLARIREGGWDVVVLQGRSNDATDLYDSFVAGATSLDGEIRAIGAQTMLYMTWSYQDQLTGSMTQDVAEAYLGLGASLGAEVVPCGLAWKWMCDNTGLRMYDDNIHPNTYGVYLVGCMFYAALFDQSPEGNTYGSDYGVSGTIASNIQGLAWDYVSGDTVGGTAIRVRQQAVDITSAVSRLRFDLQGRILGGHSVAAKIAKRTWVVRVSPNGRLER